MMETKTQVDFGFFFFLGNILYSFCCDVLVFSLRIRIDVAYEIKVNARSVKE